MLRSHRIHILDGPIAGRRSVLREHAPPTLCFLFNLADPSWHCLSGDHGMSTSISIRLSIESHPELWATAYYHSTDPACPRFREREYRLTCWQRGFAATPDVELADGLATPCEPWRTNETKADDVEHLL